MSLDGFPHLCFLLARNSGVRLPCADGRIHPGPSENLPQGSGQHLNGSDNVRLPGSFERGFVGGGCIIHFKDIEELTTKRAIYLDIAVGAKCGTIDARRKDLVAAVADGMDGEPIFDSEP
jgi:hypothetical protein